MIAARSSGNPTIVKSPRKTALDAVFSCRKETTLNMHLGDTRLLIEVGRERGLLRNQMAIQLFGLDRAAELLSALPVTPPNAVWLPRVPR
jgi:hypothetical protein